ncbi:acetoacetate decarboxylase [cyanobacterium TDX16]|nr:acetoacetate decarboxylase [cyanobacterium TDX16]
MSYPQAPWTLQGYAYQTLQLLECDRVRPLIPSELNLVSVFPGKTVGGIYLSNYGAGSVLEYSELIVVAGFVSYGAKIGGWVSHIYVDNPDSVAGGREIWGLPKEIADFTWTDRNVTVRQGDRILCCLKSHQQNFGLPIPLGASSFSSLNSNLLLFPAQLKARLGLVSSQLEIPPESPFGGLDLGQPWLTVHADQMELTVGQPSIVGQRDLEFNVV